VVAVVAVSSPAQLPAPVAGHDGPSLLPCSRQRPQLLLLLLLLLLHLLLLLLAMVMAMATLRAF
jgi:hypothetical protein